MSGKRMTFGAALVGVTLLSGFTLFRAQPAAAQQPAIPEIRAGAIPKAWGRLVAPDAWPQGGAALIFEATDGTVRIVKVEGQMQVIVFPRN